MSSKTDKFLESAQKFIAKGQLDRAIRDYEQVVALEPGDIRHRQRLAELLVRINRKGEAIGEYEAIGKYYADNAYYLKAIAVYKQIQKLDPTNHGIALTLAVLNEKQGLVGNALAEYTQVFNHFQKEGNLSEAINILHRMLAADPGNLNTQLKSAETHYAAGNKDEAYQQFSRLSRLLMTRGDKPLYDKVCQRIQALFPDRKELGLDSLSALIERGEAAQAVCHLQDIIKKDPTNLRAWRLLVSAYGSEGETEKLKLSFRHMIRFFPHESFPREGLVQSVLDEADVETGLGLLKEHTPHFLAKGEFETLERFYLVLRQLAPTDVRVLEGLKHLYGEWGEEEKLAQVNASLNPPADETMTEGEAQESGHLSPDAAALPAVEPSPTQEAEWEEEIDLSCLEEVAGLEVSSTPVAPEDESLPDFVGWCDESPVTEMGGAGETVDMPAGETAGEEALWGEDIELELEVGEADDGLSPEREDAEDLPGGTARSGPAMPGEDHSRELAVEGRADGATPGGDEYFDLGAALLSDATEETPPAVTKRDKYSLDGLFTEFKKGVDRQLEEGDTETHYNLGIAYKEMGLYDDAIAEFRVAALDPVRKVDCLTLQGMCHRDKGDAGRAEETYREGLAMPGKAEELASLKYELALLYESVSRKEDALHLYREVQASVPDFRDAVRKIAALQGGGDGQEPYDLDLVELDAEDE